METKTMSKTKVALITGAGTGIGKATAISLYLAGYSVVLTGRRMEKLYETAKVGVCYSRFGGCSFGGVDSVNHPFLQHCRKASDRHSEYPYPIA